MHIMKGGHVCVSLSLPHLPLCPSQLYFMSFDNTLSLVSAFYMCML